MKIFPLIILCLTLFVSGCGPKAPASIKERGMKPVNDLKYYPYLTDSERTKFEKMREGENAPQKITRRTVFDNDGVLE